jgi:Raf kinase inhibitor-like YbhB/YbcL family protein
MELRSDAFEPGGTIPRRHGRDGGNKSPPLSWSGLPGDAKSLALIVEDPDAPGRTFTHWVIWDIPVTNPGLREGVSHAGDFNDGTRQGDNDFDERGYSGPRPPRGETHRYVFRLFAIDEKLELEEGATKDQLLEAMRGHVLDRAELVGNHSR